MVKSWAESLTFNECRLRTSLTWSDLNPVCHFVQSASSLPLMPGRAVGAVANKKYVAVHASTWAVSTTIADAAIWH